MRLSLAAVTTAGAAAAVAAYRRQHSEDDLAGEVAVVTGASRGLGLLVATELARRGCRLIMCAKFAAVGFSEGLRAELGRGPVTVTTVVPGLMRTGSHVRAGFAGRKNAEFTWFSLGASLPLVSMDAERAAGQIVAGMAARRAEVFLTPAAQVVGRLASLAPEVTVPVLHAVQNAVLPDPDSDGAAVPGRQLHPTLPASVFGVLTSLGRAAAARFNELGRTPVSNSGNPSRGRDHARMTKPEGE
jgi:hypothetical protein